MISNEWQTKIKWSYNEFFPAFTMRRQYWKVKENINVCKYNNSKLILTLLVLIYADDGGNFSFLVTECSLKLVMQIYLFA